MKKNKKYLPGLIFVTALLILSITFVLNFHLIRDFILSLSFHPSAEISAIEDKLNLTDRAKLIFAASNPTLNQSETFNIKCNSNNTEVSVLGCYTGDQIYVYDIKTDELNGILESVMAHELLHAVWNRLSDGEKAALTNALEEVYQSSESIKNELSIAYNEAERFNELFARAGTEVKNLPTTLETMYARFFKNQDTIVDYYNSYSEPFNKLKQRAKEILTEIETLGPAVEAKITDYENRHTNFAAAVSAFNNCADTIGCFKNYTAFSTRRQELLAEQSALNALHDEISADLLKYNSLIDEYNTNSSQTNHLNNIINSNAPSLEEL